VLVAGPGDASVPYGFVDGNYKDARFKSPAGMMMGLDGRTAYICDYGNNAIRTLNTTTLDVGTYASGSPLVNPIHLTVARSGNIYVACAQDYSQAGPVVKITPGRSMSIIGQAHSPRGIAVDSGETVCYLMEQGHYFFTELWAGAHADLTMGGTLTDRDYFGQFGNAEGMCLAPDGYLYGVCSDTYYYSTGAGLKRFTPGAGNTWNESGAPPGGTSFGPFSSPSGGDYGTRRIGIAARNGSDGRMWFYTTTRSGVSLTKVELGATGGIHSDEQIGSATHSFGIALNSQDTVYYSDSSLSVNNGSIYHGPSGRVWYGGIGGGLNSIYKIGCPPNPNVEDSKHSTRLVLDDEVVNVRAVLKGSPSVTIDADRDRCGRPVPAEASRPLIRLRVRTPWSPG
jgi:sugar lactone lactonase YvrE